MSPSTTLLSCPLDRILSVYSRERHVKTPRGYQNNDYVGFTGDRQNDNTHRLLDAESCRNCTSLGGLLCPILFPPQQSTCPFGRKPQLLSLPATTWSKREQMFKTQRCSVGSVVVTTVDIRCISHYEPNVRIPISLRLVCVILKKHDDLALSC